MLSNGNILLFAAYMRPLLDNLISPYLVLLVCERLSLFICLLCDGYFSAYSSAILGLPHLRGVIHSSSIAKIESILGDSSYTEVRLNRNFEDFSEETKEKLFQLFDIQSGRGSEDFAFGQIRFSIPFSNGALCCQTSTHLLCHLNLIKRTSYDFLPEIYTSTTLLFAKLTFFATSYFLLQSFTQIKDLSGASIWPLL